MKNPFKLLNKFDLVLLPVSIAILAAAFTISPKRDYLTLFSSVTGVIALMFIVKGHVLGQFMTVAFAVCYGVVSYFFDYYGEMITYLGMSAPAAIVAIIAWLRHPYKTSSQVEIASLGKRKLLLLIPLTAAVTTAFYFILRALGTKNLALSTVSVATSVVAASLAALRSPLYGVAYAANDIVLIALWVLAVVEDTAYVPMIICFALFLLYDTYGYINWTLMRKRQSAGGKAEPKTEPDAEPKNAPKAELQAERKTEPQANADATE